MTAMVETNPDYSRQMYEPQYNSHRPPDPPVVTSGLVSESDIRHQERQERLKYELSKEYHDHMQKPSDGFYSDEAPFHVPESDTGGFKDQRMPVYYRREPPEEGLPLGNYAHARRALDEERHREYNRFMHEKEEAARQRREEIMRRQSPTRQPPQSDMYDHNQMSQHLREERRREYNDFLDPRSQHNGDYNDMNDQRRQEELELNPQRKPPTPLGGLPVGAYEQQRKRLQAERTREYRDSLLKQAYDQWTRHAKEMHLDSSPVHGGHYDTERPLVGSPRDIIIDYKKLKKQLGEERKFDYNRYVAQKENETHNRTPPTPPVGLNIPTEAERLRITELRKRQYGADLRRQHQEQILNRAQNQVDMPVLDRRNQSPVRDAYNSPSVPPLGLDRRPPSGRWDPESYRQTNYAPVKQGEGPPSRGRQASRGRISSRENQDSINQPPFLQDRPSSQDRGYVPTMKPSSRELYRPQDRSDYNPDYNPDPSVRLSSPPHQANIGADDYSEYRRKVERDSRNSEYNQFLARKQVEDDARKQKMNEVRRQPAAPVVKGDYYDSESYDLKRQYLMEEKHKEYQNYLKKPVTPPIYGLPIGPQQYVKTKKMLELQRNRDYNEYLRKKGENSELSREVNGFTSLPMTESEIKYKQYQSLARRQRNLEYNLFQKQKSESAGRSPTPTNLGLPLSQNEYDSRRKHLELERNKEYNELLAKKGEPFARYDMRNRSDNESPRAKGVELSVRSDLQDQDSEGDKSPHRSRSNAYYGSTIGALLTGKELNYPNSARQRFLEEKKHAYNEQVKPEKADTKRREEQKYKMQTYGIDLDTVKIFPQGEYVEKHKALEQEWRKDYRDFASKKREALREDIARREAMYNQHLNQAMESPPIIPTGEYDLKKKQFQDQWKDEWKSYLERVPQPKNERSTGKDFWGNDERVRTIPQSGEFKGRKERMQSELRKELHEYLDKQPSPRERKKDFGYPGAVLFDGEYEPIRRKVQAERRQEFLRYMEKQGDLQPRKPYNPNGPENRIGFMANLGTSLDRQRESLAHQRHEEYNNFLKDRYALHGKPQGRPSWVDRQVLPDSWYKPSIQRNDDRTSKPRDERPDDRPGSQRRSGTNQSYEDMLQAKRRQEANYRREDYHDYSRPGDRY